MAAPALVVDEHAVLHAALDGLLRRLHDLCGRKRLDISAAVIGGTPAPTRDSPGRQRQNLSGFSFTSMSLLASTSGPRTSTGLGAEPSTLWTRWYIRLTPSEQEGTGERQEVILSPSSTAFLHISGLFGVFWIWSFYSSRDTNYFSPLQASCWSLSTVRKLYGCD